MAGLEELKDDGMDRIVLLSGVIMPHLNDRELRNKLKDIRPDFTVLYRSGYTADVIAKHGVLEKTLFSLRRPSRERLSL